MLRTKKLLCHRCVLFGAALGAFVFAGCGEPGPKALLQGDRLIQKGQYADAIKPLKAATDLLPRNAQAWNRLGLAYQGSRQPDEAFKAYKKALQADYRLADPHFNLGCLWLDQSKPIEALDELVIFTSLNPKQAEGWLKLGTAQLRARRFDPAEKSLKIVLALQPRNPEALNNLGIIAVERKRPQDALAAFNAALAAQVNYAPAILNAAILAQQHLNDRSLALRKYRDYLAATPRPSNWNAVNSLAQQIEIELSQAARATRILTKTNAMPVATNIVLVATQKKPATGTTPAVPERVVSPSPTNAVKKTAISNIESAAVPTARAPTVEVTRLPDEIKVKPAQDASPKAEPRATNALAENAASQLSAPVLAQSSPRSDKPAFFQRLNPFRKRPKNEPLMPAATEAKPATPIVSASSNPSPTMAMATRPQPTPPPPIPRYRYQSPPKPAEGNRRDAEHYFVQGLQAQRKRRLPEAVTAYRAATQADPGYFEAHYNLGLAAFEVGNWNLSLNAYENALAITADSVNARFNFALALKQAGYYRDAANELETVLTGKPDETRAHLTLANLYAQQLNEPKQARAHYLKVLEVDPRHPQAAAIRSWLAANP